MPDPQQNSASAPTINPEQIAALNPPVAPQPEIDLSNIRYRPVDQPLSKEPSVYSPDPGIVLLPHHAPPKYRDTHPNPAQPLNPMDVVKTPLRGVAQAVRGVQTLADPSGSRSSGELWNAGSDIIEGGMKAGTISLPFAAAADPLALTEVLGAGGAGQYITEKGATALGATPEQARFAGNVGAIAVPTGISALPARPEGSAFFPNRESGAVNVTRKMPGDPFELVKDLRTRPVQEPSKFLTDAIQEHNKSERLPPLNSAHVTEDSRSSYTYKYGDFPPQKATILPEEFHGRVEKPSSAQEQLGEIAKTYGLSSNASHVQNGASFITPEGKFIHLGAADHPMVISKAAPERADEIDPRVSFINESGAIRTRYTVDRGGPTLHVSVPKTGKSDTEGIGTEIYPEAKQRFENAPTAQDISAFHEKNKAVLDQYPELRVGWDKDASKDKPYELNIGAAGKDEESVKQIARTLDQRSAYNIGKQKELPTSGKNERQDFTNYPLSERISDLRGTTEKGPAGYEHLPKTLHDSMEPDERELVEGNKTLQQNITRSYRNIRPSLEETTNSMQAGAMNAGWWQRFMDAFGIMGGADKDTGVSHADWLDAGKPKDRTSINNIVNKWGKAAGDRGFKGNAAISDTLDAKGNIISKGIDTNKLWQLVNSPEMRGEKPFGGQAIGGNPLAGKISGAIKIPSMGATVVGEGNLNRLVLDAHGQDFYGHNQWSDVSYISHSIHMRKAAEAIGLKGGEGQEQQWGVILGLKSLLKEGMSPAEAAKGITDPFILKMGKDYAEIIKNDPESNGIFERLKNYGLKSGSEIQAGLDRIIATRPKPRPTEETGVNQTLLENTAKRIKESISPAKIKKTAGSNSSDAGGWLQMMKDTSKQKPRGDGTEGLGKSR